MRLRISRRRVGLTAVAVICAAALGLVIWRLLPHGPATDGPLDTGFPHGSLFPAKPGHILADGGEKLEVKGDQPAIITAIRPVGGEHALKLLGYLIASPKRRLVGLTQEFLTFPPKAKYVAGTLSPAIGAVLQPYRKTHGMGYELIVGYRMTADRFDARSGLIIDYTVAGKKYELFDPARIVICPTRMTMRQCDARSDKIFPDG